MTAPAALGDVVVVGAPRSGTSLVAQLLSAGGLDFGDALLPASEANPRGFLEDVRATDLDDELLAPHVVDTGLLPVPEARLAWVGAPHPDVTPVATADQVGRMRSVLAGPGRRGLKDPRLVFALDAWRPALRPGTGFVAVFRRPDEVAASLRRLGEGERAYFGDVATTEERGLRLWEAGARRLLSLVEGDGPWLVVDHADLLGGDAVGALAGFTGLPVDASGVDHDLHRNRRPGAAPADLAPLLARLQAHARADRERWSDRAA